MSAVRGRAAKVAAKATAKRAAKRPVVKGPAVKKAAAKAVAKAGAAKRAVVGRPTATRPAAKGLAAKRPAAKVSSKAAAKRVPVAAPSGRGGMRVWGTNHPAALLTERQVIRFRRLVRTGKATVGELAAEEGCGHARISMAVRGQTWAYLNDVAPPVIGGSRGVR